MARTLELDTIKFPSSSTANLTLSDGGTLFGGTVDINAGNIDGTPIGANAISTAAVTSLTASLTAAITGNTTVGGTLGVTGDVAINTNKFTVDASTGNTLIAGTLTVNGGTTTIDTTNLAIKDTLITLNSGASSGVDSGILVERGSTGNNAILFWDHDATKWTLGTTTAEPTTTGDLNVTTGTLVVATLEGNVTGALTGNATTATTLATGRTIGMTGDVVWTSPSFNGSGNVTASATIQPNSVEMPAMTEGAYVRTVSAGGGITVSGSGAEDAVVTVTHTDTSSQGSVDNSGNTWIQDITLDTYGHVTGITSDTIDGYNNSNWDTAHTDRFKWDGGNSGLTPETGRTSLELGTMATQASNNVSITGGSISGVANTSGGSISDMDYIILDATNAGYAGIQFDSATTAYDIYFQGKRSHQSGGGYQAYSNITLGIGVNGICGSNNPPSSGSNYLRNNILIGKAAINSDNPAFENNIILSCRDSSGDNFTTSSGNVLIAPWGGAFGEYNGSGTTNITDTIAIGTQVAYSASFAKRSIIIGHQAAYTGCGDYEIYLGYKAGWGSGYQDSNTMYNVAIGAHTGSGLGAGDENNIMLGLQAGSPTYSPAGVSGDNRIVLGNNSITNADIKVSWNVTSDERDKADITQMTHGLDVVNNINPINYVWDTRSDYYELVEDMDEENDEDKNKIIKHASDGSKKQSGNPRTGFSSQNVKAALDAVSYGATNSVVNTENDDKWSLCETNIIPFLVNAVKELSTKVAALEAA